MQNSKKSDNNKTHIITVRFNPRELEIAEQRLAQTNLNSLSEYIRKMAVDGIIVNLNLQEIHDLNVSLMNIRANINQIAKRVNSTNRIYDEDIKYLTEVSEQIWQSLKSVQSKLLSL